MLQDDTPYTPLTKERIRQVLEWWLQRRHANSDKNVGPSSIGNDATALNDYQRLMEIYCIVKVGGVKGQIETAQLLLAREKRNLEAEIATLDNPDSSPGRINLLRQEILELENSTRWRISQLKSIQAEEEKAVTHCFLIIENALSDLW